VNFPFSGDLLELRANLRTHRDLAAMTEQTCMTFTQGRGAIAVLLLAAAPLVLLHVGDSGGAAFLPQGTCAKTSELHSSRQLAQAGPRSRFLAPTKISPASAGWIIQSTRFYLR